MLPTYEYQCNDCGTRFERRQSFDDEPICACPECSNNARRVIHSVPIVFKGSGFYCTDNGRGSTRSSSRKPDDGESENVETKPEAKTEVKAEAAVGSKTETSSEGSG